MHERLDEKNTLESNLVIEFKKKYNLLLTDIEKYRFREDSSKGFATKQNRNSQMILSDLQILNGLLDDNLQRIDRFLVDSNSNEYLDLKKIFNNVFKRIIQVIDNSREALKEARSDYYDFEKKPNKKNSAVNARIWKKERNNTLSSILSWSITLVSLRDMAEQKYFKNYDKDYIETYQHFIDYLMTRPNYYSYLKAEEQINETEINKNIKRKSKHSN